MSRLARIHSWTFDSALPFWLERGLDRANGGFVEALTLTGEDTAVDFKRTRVTCRQIYVFSHAAILGWADGLDAAISGAQWLTEHAWRGDGFVRRLARDGRVLDQTVDLYDNAFALFAFAWLHRATGETWAADWAARTLNAVEMTLAHPSGLGFANDDAGNDGFRLQNPHMHLTEACLAAHQATGAERYLRRAIELADLCEAHFFDGYTLAEYFSDDWTRAAGEPGFIVEPGHMFEWAWILAQLGKQSGSDRCATIEALITFAERHGVHPQSGATYDAVRQDGVVLQAGSRAWPNTERLKAAVAATETLRADAEVMANSALDVLFSRYLSGVPAGGWIDQFDGAGAPVSQSMPASTLYHVFLAFTEALRLGDRLTR